MGIRVNGVSTNNISYADDTVLIAENIEDLRRITEKVQIVSKQYRLHINTKKTKYMHFSKVQDRNIQLQKGNNHIKKNAKVYIFGDLD